MEEGHVVVGVDGSAASQEALRWALGLGEALDAEVIAVHAVGLLEEIHDAGAPSADWRAKVRDLVEDTWCDSLRAASCRQRVELRDGHPVDVLLQTAAEEGAELLVMGTRGVGANPALALGSTSLRVLQIANLPVLVVPQSGGVGRAGDGFELQRILVGVDRSEPSLAALELSADVAQLLGGSLSVLEVIEFVPPFPLGSATAVTSRGEVTAPERAMVLIEAAARGIRDRGVDVQIIVQSGEPAPALLEMADELNVDLVVVGSRGRGGPTELLLGSVARTVADRVRRPTLVVPAAAGAVHLRRRGRRARAAALRRRLMSTSARAGRPEDVLEQIYDGADLIVPLANGEPVSVLDAIEAEAEGLRGVRVHQMHALHDRPYLHGKMRDHLMHVSYFLSPVTRPAFHERGCDLVPNHFSEVPRLLRETTKCSMVLAAAAPMDRHGYFSLGTNCDYVAPFIGRVPFFLEVNARMPRTFGRNQVHISQVTGWTEVDRSLVEMSRSVPSDIDERIAAYVVERIPDGATIQAGIGAIPNALLAALRDHRHLGVHTEMLSDAVIHLVASGVVTGTRKRLAPGKVVTTFALGTQELYDFLHENPAVEFLPVDYVNDPRVIAREHCFVSINATTEVDLVGQCASETVAGRYWSSSGGQADFARGAMYSRRGRAFVVLPSTACDGAVSRITASLTPGSMVTTTKNTVDHIVTEYGVADMRGRSLSQRATALICIAHPRFRDELTAEARRLSYL